MSQENAVTYNATEYGIFIVIALWILCVVIILLILVYLDPLLYSITCVFDIQWNPLLHVYRFLVRDTLGIHHNIIDVMITLLN